jgi:hypothetical protein
VPRGWSGSIREPGSSFCRRIKRLSERQAEAASAIS